jgi:hypothetical protein
MRHTQQVWIQESEVKDFGLKFRLTRAAMSWRMQNAPFRGVVVQRIVPLTLCSCQAYPVRSGSAIARPDPNLLLSKPDKISYEYRAWVEKCHSHVDFDAVSALRSLPFTPPCYLLFDF